MILETQQHVGILTDHYKLTSLKVRLNNKKNKKEQNVINSLKKNWNNTILLV